MTLSEKQVKLLLNKFKNANSKEQKHQIKRFLIDDYKNAVNDKIDTAQAIQSFGPVIGVNFNLSNAIYLVKTALNENNISLIAHYIKLLNKKVSEDAKQFINLMKIEHPEVCKNHPKLLNHLFKLGGN